jgi:hypothetical protein
VTAVACLTAFVATTACTTSGAGTVTATGTSTSPAGTTAAGPAGTTTAAASGPARPGTLAAVTTGGAVVLLDPETGAVTRTLVSSGAVGDAIAVSPDGKTLYYEFVNGCQHQIWRVPTSGGSTTEVASQGRRPALSPDGTMLAYARAPYLVPEGNCGFPPNASDADYQLVVLHLATGQTRSLPMAVRHIGSDPGGAAAISHLSWSPNGSRLAVTTQQPDAAQSFVLQIVDPSSESAYEDGSIVPVPGDAQSSFYREAVYLPDGYLFAVRECCVVQGLQAAEDRPSSVTVLEIDPNYGAVAGTVATGLVGVDHTSLDASTNGHWLLYLSGTSLEVSQDGAKPSVLATGIVAAAW